METYSLLNFQKYLLSFNKNSYFYEVLLTDFFCFYKDVDADIVYVTQNGNDGKIDAIVIPKNLNLGVINIYCIQITTSIKSINYLEDFKNINPYSIEQYKNILPIIKEKVEIKKVLISFYESKSYESYQDKIEIICGKNLSTMIFENSIRYHLLLSNNKFEESYLKNVSLREGLWTYLHRIKAYDTNIISYYIYFFTLNLKFIKTRDFMLLDNLLNISSSSNKDIIEVLKKIDKNKYELLFNSDYLLLDLIVKTYKCSNKINNNIVDLIIFLHSLTEESCFETLKIIPTKLYLSIYYNNLCISYMPYNFYNTKNKKACFSFKCNFDDLYNLGNTHIDDCIKNNRLISTKEANKVINGLKHSGMQSTLRYPNLSDDISLIKFMLKLSTI